MSSECDRCGAALRIRMRTRQQALCRPCSATLDKIISRWMDGPRDHYLYEFAAELGITEDSLSSRIRRINEVRRKSGQTNRSTLVV